MKRFIYTLLLFLGGYAALHAQQQVAISTLDKKYDMIEPFYEGFACVKYNNLWGMIDQTGKEIVACKYQDLRGFSENLACCKRNDKWGFIDKNGREFIECQYQYVRPFHKGLAGIQQNDKRGIIDKTGRVIVPCKYQYMPTVSDTINYIFAEDYQVVMQNDLYGIIDITGKEIVPCKYEEIKFNTLSLQFFNQGLALCKREGLYGFVDKARSSLEG